MAQLPNNFSDDCKKLNPHLFPSAKHDGAKEVMTTEAANAIQPQLRSGTIPQGDPVTTGERASESNTRQFIIHADPVPAPRMTKRDAYRVTPKYPRRPCVQRYFDFQDLLQRTVGDIPVVPDEVIATFHFPMPDSWSKSKRQAMHGQPHRQRPDGDNCLKSIFDSLFLEDGGVWKGSFEKRWSIHGRVEIEMRWL